MKTFKLTWKECRQAVIEAETEAEAWFMYESGDYDSEYVGEEDFNLEETND